MHIAMSAFSVLAKAGGHAGNISRSTIWCLYRDPPTSGIASTLCSPAKSFTLSDDACAFEEALLLPKIAFALFPGCSA